MVTIQPVTVELAQELSEISIETFNDTFGEYNDPKDLEKLFATAYNVAELTRQIQNPHSDFEFIYVDNQLAGYLKLNVDDAQSEKMGNQTLEVERIYIRKSFKRRGLGTQLMDYAMHQACKMKKTSLWLGVWEHNPGAIAFYENQGFKSFSSHVFMVGNDRQKDILMKKTL